MSSQDTLFVPKVTNITSAWLQPENDLVWKGRGQLYATTTGSANAQVLTLPSPSLYAGYVAGDSFTFKAGYSSTSACTLTVVGASSLAATTLKINGDITGSTYLVAGNVYTVIYDGTYFQTTQVGSPKMFRSVTEWGVVGNGSTDDTTAFQAAITACAGHWTLIVDYGLNCIVSGLTLPASTHLVINGTIKLKASSNTHVVWIQGSNVVIEGTGTIDGNASNNTNPMVPPYAGIGGIISTIGSSPSTNLSNIIVKDITITNVVNWPISLNSVLNGKIIGCTFTSSGNAPQFNAGSSFCTVTNCYSYNIPDYGFAFYEGCNNCIASNNVISNCATFGVLNDGAATGYNALPQYNHVMSNNVINNATAYGIAILNETGSAGANHYNIVLSNNIINNAGVSNVSNATGILIDYSTGVSISGNTISGGGTSGHPWVGITVGNSCLYTKINGNTISNGGQHGASTAVGITTGINNYLTITDNVIYDNQGSPTMQYGFTGNMGTGNIVTNNNIWGMTVGVYASVFAADSIYLGAGPTGIATSTLVLGGINGNYYEGTHAITATAGGTQAVPVTVLGYLNAFVGAVPVKIPYFSN